MSEDSVKNDSSTEEIDLLELAKKLWAKRRFIGKYAIIAAVIGLIIGFSIPKEYTSGAKMAPEGLKNTSGSNLAGLAALAGFDLSSGGNMEGINLTLYPDVVQSTPFMVELSQIPVQPKDEKKMSLYDYIANEISSPWWSYVLGLPMKAIGWIASIGKESTDTMQSINPLALSREQSTILKNLSGRLSVAVDKKTGVITASSTMQDPTVAAAVTDSMISKLEEYMADYRTEKAKRDCDFTQESYLTAQERYLTAQRKYAAFMDATQNTARQSVVAEQDRLRNEVTLAYGVYSQLAQQLEMAKIKVQEQTPCVTVIEPAGVPTQKSNTSKVVILIAFVFLGVVIASGYILVKDMFFTKKEDNTKSDKDTTSDIQAA